MKSALSLTLIASLVGSALPVAAEDRMESKAGPIARAVTRQAVRLGVDAQNEPADSDWTRVRALVPGTEVIVTTKNARLRKRYVVRADESELVVKATDRGRVEAVARTNVVEIGIPVSRHPARTGALIGAAVGFGVALGSFGRACGSDGCYAGLIWPLFAGIGAGSGAGIGALIGASSDDMPYVIYRAP